MVKFVQILYKIALSKSSTVFFQNKDDLSYFIKNNIVKLNQASIVPGSGVNEEYFYYSKLINNNKKQFLMISRLLNEKGVNEFYEAAKILIKKGYAVVFKVIGDVDTNNPSSISNEKLKEWKKEKYVNFVGFVDDVREEIKKSYCVVLPSYREGTPRSLLEAAAMGRPLISSNSIGCKEVVIDNFNGYLAEIKNAQDLYLKMEKMFKLPYPEALKFGINSRKLILHKFKEQYVVDKYMSQLSMG